MPINGYLSDPFLRGYFGCALWTGTDGGLPLDERFSISGFSLESIQQAAEECQAFQEANASDLEYVPTSPDGNSAEEYAGYLFWLSRCGYGTGFFDSYEIPEEIRDRLQDASRAAGNRDVYIGDSGELYIA